MRYLSLLPFGRQFTPVERQTGRYQQAREGLVPDFSQPRNPLPTPPAKTGSSPARVTESAGPATSQPQRTGDSPFRATLTGEVLPVNPGLATAPRNRRRLPAWLEQLLLGLLRPGNRRRGTREVQSELSFQSVTPARNDLTTADLELVPARRLGGPNGLSPACRQRVLRLWWDQGTRRIRRLGNLWP